MTSTSTLGISIRVFAVPTHASNQGNASTATLTLTAAPHSHATLAIVLVLLSIVISFVLLIILICTAHGRRGLASSSLRVLQPPPAVAITAPTPASNSTRGVDPTTIQQHLPLFSFKFLKGNTRGLECAVCLIQYEDTDVLRFLPSCHHAFHVECIDKWLESRCSCPLCRHKVSSSQDSTTTILVDNYTLAMEELASDPRRSLELAGDASLQLYVSPEEANIAVENSPIRSHQFLGRNRESSAAASDSARLSPRKRRLAHRIVISDVLLQQRWSDLAPADVLFLNSQTILGSINSNCISFSSEGNPRWSTSSASRLSTSSPAKSTAEVSQKQKSCDPPDLRHGTSSNVHSANDHLLASESCILEKNPFIELGSSCRQLMNAGDSQRSLSEITGLDRFSQSVGSCRSDQLYFSTSGSVLLHRHQTAQDEDEEQMKRWLRIASRTLKRLIRKDRPGSNKDDTAAAAADPVGSQNRTCTYI